MKSALKKENKRDLIPKRFNIIVTSGISARPKRINIRTSVILFYFLLVVGLLGFMLGVVTSYFTDLKYFSGYGYLYQKNLRLVKDVGILERHYAAVKDRLVRMEDFKHKMERLIKLNDEARGLAIGPLVVQAGATDLTKSTIYGPYRKDHNDPVGGSVNEAKIELLKNTTDLLAERLKKITDGLDSMEKGLSYMVSKLANSPAIYPVHGWITSGFGVRIDPFTGLNTFHEGLDISIDEGTPVKATANGVVIFVGENSGFGNTVKIFHGNGIVTLYGHLRDYTVRTGDRVKRGDIIGHVGNTGRSTGPHLHYEVRVDGIPVNPQNYILESF